MVPRWVVLLDALPLSANGKVQRDKLPPPAESAGAQQEGGEGGGDADTVKARDEYEEKVLACFSAVLRQEAAELSVEKSFFAMGGDSLSALRLLIALQQEHQLEVSIPTLFQRPTVAALAAMMRAAAGPAGDGGGDGTDEGAEGRGEESGGAMEGRGRSSSRAAPSQLQLLPIQEGDAEQFRPLFLIHAAGASALAYRTLAEQLDPRQPVYALEDSSLAGKSLTPLQTSPPPPPTPPSHTHNSNIRRTNH